MIKTNGSKPLKLIKFGDWIDDLDIKNTYSLAVELESVSSTHMINNKHL